MADDADDIATELTRPAEAPAPGSTAPADDSAAAPSRDDGGDIESLLQEFDRSTLKAGMNGDARGAASADPGAARNGKAPAAGSNGHAPAGGLADMLAPLAAETAKLANARPEQLNALSPEDALALRMRSDLHHAVLDEFIRQAHHANWQQQARNDFSEVLTYAKGEIEGANVPPDHVERYLIAEYNLNPELKAAWDHRGDSPEARGHFNRVVTRTVKKMEKEARAIPVYDKDATEDREAITNAVRGANMRAPEPTQADYARKVSRQTDAEFAAEKDKLWG